MAGGLRQRAMLAPTGHAAIDQSLVAAEDDIRPEAEALHHAGAIALHQRIGAIQQRQHLCDGSLVLEIDLDDLAAA
jgi:hypothetical protein